MISNFAHILRVGCELLPQLVVSSDGTLVSYLDAISLRLKITKFCLLISVIFHRSVWTATTFLESGNAGSVLELIKTSF